MVRKAVSLANSVTDQGNSMMLGITSGSAVTKAKSALSRETE